MDGGPIGKESGAPTVDMDSRAIAAGTATPANPAKLVRPDPALAKPAIATSRGPATTFLANARDGSPIASVTPAAHSGTKRCLALAMSTCSSVRRQVVRMSAAMPASVAMPACALECPNSVAAVMLGRTSVRVPAGARPVLPAAERDHISAAAVAAADISAADMSADLAADLDPARWVQPTGLAAVAEGLTGDTEPHPTSG